MDIAVKRSKIGQFSILVLIIGAFLLLISIIRGADMIIAFAKGIPLHTFYDIKINVINVFFNFIIPFIGGILLLISGFTMLKHSKTTAEQKRTRRFRQRQTARREDLLSGLLNADEKNVLGMIREQSGILQSDLVAKSGYSKVKMHRVLKKLESMDVIKRSRFGITNRIFLNEKA